MFFLLESQPLLFQILCIILGLIAGSFLNVVIYRLPLTMLQSDSGLQPEPFNLLLPGSHCPSCKKKINILDNIPVLGFIFLKGRCRHCNNKIARQYPVVEIASAVLTWYMAWHFGWSVEFAAAMILAWALLSLTVIDINHQLLPDVITLPLLWVGLMVNTQNIFSPQGSTIWGAVLGYLALWITYWLFKLITKKEGMGYGDFKLLAALGAWLGWQALPMIILLSSLLGSITGLLLIICYGRNRHIPLAFGPWLALAGIIVLLWGHELQELWLHLIRGTPVIFN